MDNGTAARHGRASRTVTKMCRRLQGCECDFESDLIVFALSGPGLGYPVFLYIAKRSDEFYVVWFGVYH